LLKQGGKSEKIDAGKLAELLRNGSLSAVYHGEHGLRVERIISQLFDHQQGSRAGDESDQGVVSELGHSL
jgi:hypothetical protein